MTDEREVCLPVTPDKAAAIAHGHEPFDTERPVPEPIPVITATTVNQLLTRAVVGMAVVTIVTVACLAAFSIFRGWERRSFDTTVAALDASVVSLKHELDIAQEQRAALRAQVENLQRSAECRAMSQANVDIATADVLTVLGEQFASAIDRVPPAPDPAAVSAATDELKRASIQRRADLARCATPAAPTSTVPGG